MLDTAIAVAALAISLMVAIWTFARYLLEGGRVRIRLRPGCLAEGWLAQSTRSWASLARQQAKRDRWYAEAAVVEVENPGRSAVTISEVSPRGTSSAAVPPRRIR